MFPRVFNNDVTSHLMTHNALHFYSDLPQKKLIALIIKMGVPAFVTPDVENPTYGQALYNDNRISGGVSWRLRAGCCSFVKDPSQFYLFPIHEAQLRNVGLTGDDLVYWLNWLNGAKMGFKYSYLGVQEGNEKMNVSFSACMDGYNRVSKTAKHALVPTNEYHWILVPRFSSPGGDMKKTYLHWIALRWLINTRISTHDVNMNEGITRLGYHNIPRIAMMFNEDFGLSRIKSILYANIASPFFYYYSLLFSDTMHTIGRKSDVSVTAAEFKKLLGIQTADGAMNTMLSLNNNQTRNYPLPRPLVANYNHNTLFTLFQSGDYAGFIKHIEDSYKPKSKTSKTKKDASKKKAVSR